MADRTWVRGHHPQCRNVVDCTCADDLDPCNCLAYDPEHNDHSEHEHTRCGGNLNAGTLPCGGCDDCVSAQVASAGRGVSIEERL